MKTTRIGWGRSISPLAAFGLLGTIIFSSGAFEGRANADDLLLNFDTAPFPTNAGPNNFLAAGPMQTYSVPDQFTISGGVILGNPTFLPAFTNSGSPPNLYATADFADPSLLPDILLTLNTNRDATVVQGLLFNGQTISENYSISAYDANSNLLYSQIYLVPPDLTTNGYTSFTVFSEAGPPIATVDITTPNSGVNGWDFGVDSLDVTVSNVPEPSALALTGAALTMLIWRARRIRRGRTPPGDLMTALVILGLMAVRPALAAPTWVEQGPGPVVNGQTENIGYAGVTNPVSGGVNVIVPAPNDTNTAYAGAVNGGVWVTHNVLANPPAWANLTDQQLPMQSIASLAIDPSNPNNLFAGTGTSSNYGQDGSPGVGVARSSDGGNTWTLGGMNLAGRPVYSIAAAGGGIVLAATHNNNLPYKAPPPPDAGGVFRSTDNGNSFARLSGNGASGLPDAGVSSLAPDPTATNRFYAGSPGNGVYRSDDFGATWNAMNTGLLGVGNSTRILLSVNKSTGSVYAMILTNGFYIDGTPSTNRGLHSLRRIPVHQFGRQLEPDGHAGAANFPRRPRLDQRLHRCGSQQFKRGFHRRRPAGFRRPLWRKSQYQRLRQLRRQHLPRRRLPAGCQRVVQRGGQRHNQQQRASCRLPGDGFYCQFGRGEHCVLLRRRHDVSVGPQQQLRRTPVVR